MTDTPLPHPTTSEPEGGGSIFGPVHLTRAIIIATGIVFAVIFHFAARWLPWPSEPGFRGSLAQPPVALGGFFVAIILLIVCTFAGTLIAGKRWFLAGLMTATAGLATWSVRGGTMSAVLFNAQNSGANQTVFLQMLGELIVFFGVIAALWNIVWIRSGRLTGDIAVSAEARAAQAAKLASGGRALRALGPLGTVIRLTTLLTGSSSGEDDSRSSIAAVAAQTAIMAILMMIFVVTPIKKQVLTSVFLSAMISTAIVEVAFAHRGTGRWYWIAPLLIGAVGYVAGYFLPAGIETGDLQGAFAPLTRVLPLDYASMGCAGVLLGYWWMEPDAEPEVPRDEKGQPHEPATGDGVV